MTTSLCILEKLWSTDQQIFTSDKLCVVCCVCVNETIQEIVSEHKWVKKNDRVRSIAGNKNAF